jgi:PPOX class probable F420-dependent enzyme
MAEMTKAEAYEFLDSQPGWIVLSTIDRDGYPHAVPLSYFHDGDAIYMAAGARRQRRANVLRTPRVSLLLETGTEMAELRGLVIQGDATVVEDADEVLPLSRESARRRGTPEDQLPTEVRPGSAWIRVIPRRMRSWDNPKDARDRARGD